MNNVIFIFSILTLIFSVSCSDFGSEELYDNPLDSRFISDDGGGSAVSEWTTKAPLITGRSNVVAVPVNNKIYVFGGTDGISYKNTVEAYDTLTNTWTGDTSSGGILQPMPIENAYFAGAELNGLIYIFGGENFSGTSNEVFCYDPLNNSWSTNPNSLPEPRKFISAAALDGYIYIFGGMDDSNNYCNTVYKYNNISNSWEMLDDMLNNRAQYGIAVANNKIYIIGGASDGDAYLSTVLEYTPPSTWIQLKSMDFQRMNLGCATINNRIYAIGGESGEYLNTVEEYDPVADTWVTKTSMPGGKSSFGISVVDSKIYVIGGSNGSPVDTNYEYQ